MLDMPWVQLRYKLLNRISILVSEVPAAKHLMVKEKVRGAIKCCNCLKPRCIFADKKVYDANLGVVERQKEVSGPVVESPNSVFLFFITF